MEMGYPKYLDQNGQGIPMAKEHVKELIGLLNSLTASYNRLVLVVGGFGPDRSALLIEVAEHLAASVANCNLQISTHLLNVPVPERPLQVALSLENIAQGAGGDIFLLDHTELLFDVSLKVNPLTLLQNLARNRTVVAAWNGKIKGDRLVYATQDHPEYREYKINALQFIDLEAEALAL